MGDGELVCFLLLNKGTGTTVLYWAIVTAQILYIYKWQIYLLVVLMKYELQASVDIKFSTNVYSHLNASAPGLLPLSF